MATNRTKNVLSPQLLFFMAIIAGTLGWEVLTSLLSLIGLSLDLSTGPVGFDSGVLSVYMEINPGTFLGLFLGYRGARGVAGGGRGGSRGGQRRSSAASSTRKAASKGSAAEGGNG